MLFYTPHLHFWTPSPFPLGKISYELKDSGGALYCRSGCNGRKTHFPLFLLLTFYKLTCSSICLFRTHKVIPLPRVFFVFVLINRSNQQPVLMKVVGFFAPFIFVPSECLSKHTLDLWSLETPRKTCMPLLAGNRACQCFLFKRYKRYICCFSTFMHS